MSQSKAIRETVLRSLAAVGATQEAAFYAKLFTAQDPERFALMVLDPRCLKKPLLEALLSNLRILFELGLTPVLLIGALSDDRATLKYQGQKLMRELESASIFALKLDTATYKLIPEIKKVTQGGRLAVLEMTDRRGKMNLQSLVSHLNPHKIIFLQPSGGIIQNGQRLSNLNIDNMYDKLDPDSLTSGQTRFVRLVRDLSQEKMRQTVYVMASPLNLLPELFTTQGSGTMLRRAVTLHIVNTLVKLDVISLNTSIDAAFGKPIQPKFLQSKIHKAYIENTYRGGAIVTTLAGLPYLSKFWVIQEAQGEGIGRDIWEALCADIPAFFWRSRMGNPFNGFYMRHCDGMQLSGEWRVFWKGVDAVDIPRAIMAAGAAPDDFIQ